MTQVNSDTSLAQIFTEVEDWRNNKAKGNEKMPDDIWKKIIEIIKTYPDQAKICRLLGITTKQINLKLQEFGDEHFYKDPVKLCQIPKIPTIETKPTTAKLNQDFSSLATVVVEFCRSDGCLMKIHTTTKSIHELITSFLGGNHVTANSQT